MNWAVLKDGKTNTGFLASIILGVIAVILASRDMEWWVLFMILGQMMTVLTVARADRLTRMSIQD